jgi:hypothetical protein
MPDGVHDDLRAKAIVLDDGNTVMALVACDLSSVPADVVLDARRRVKERWDIPVENILISAIHTHTGPVLTAEYKKEVGQRIADSVTTAMGRRQAARVSVAVTEEPTLPHYRRYLMKDGTIRTNPGFLNPDVVQPVGEIDPRVSLIFIEDQTGAPIATWVNYAMHLDTVGGTWISADYAYPLAQTLGRIKGPDMLTVFTIGAAGNINHWDVGREGPQRGFQEAKRLGDVVASAVLKGYTQLRPVENIPLKTAAERIDLKTQAVTAEQVEAARKVLAQPPPPGVDFTLDRVEAGKVMNIDSRRGAPIQTEVQVLRIGSVAFVAVPGELFVELGKEIKRQSPFPNTFVIELANDSIGYIPTREAFRQGSYEPTSSALAPGEGERVVEIALRLLDRVK